MAFRVTMVACVAGNPHKAWKVKLPADQHRDDPDDLAPDRELPDDVWEVQSHPFDTLDAAKQFVRILPEQTTTHVRIESDHAVEPDDTDAVVLDDGWVVIYDQDASLEHLDAAAPGVPMPHAITSPLPFDGDDEIADAPPVMPSQGAAQ